MARSIFNMPVHPAAEIFPMLAEDELAELAADIKANGLFLPLIVKDGQLIDGRNRREACKRIGVEPRVEELNGTDPVAYILSANIARRHLTKGQRAMAVAMIYPTTQQGKKGTSLKNHEVDRSYVSQARTVLTWLPQVATAVLAGTKALGDAYTEAQKSKQVQESEGQRLIRLRSDAPDLADLVDEGRISLLDAESAHATRQEDARRARQSALSVLDGLDRLIDHLETGARREHFIKMLQQPEDRKRALTVLTHWAKNIAGTLEGFRGKH